MGAGPCGGSVSLAWVSMFHVQHFRSPLHGIAMKKKTDRKSALKDAPLRTPSHGNGQLRVGNPGNKGGTGRPLNAVRALCLEGFTKAVPNLVRIAVNEPVPVGEKLVQFSKDADSISAASVLGRFAAPAQVEVGENPDTPLLTPEERKARLKGLLG